MNTILLNGNMPQASLWMTSLVRRRLTASALLINLSLSAVQAPVRRTIKY